MAVHSEYDLNLLYDGDATFILFFSFVYISTNFNETRTTNVACK